MGSSEQLEFPFPSGLGGAAPSGVSGRWDGVWVTADISEDASGVPDLLENAGAVVSRARLPAGDYLIGGRVLIERKSSGDFASSLYDGRLFRQLGYLKSTELTAALVIEGPPAYFERFWPPPLRSALAVAAVEMRVPVLFTGGPRGTALLILTLGRRAASVHREELYFPVRRRRRIFGPRERRLIAFREAFEAVPGIGPRLALALMGRFGSLKAAAAAGPDALSSIPGVGPELSRRIAAHLSKPVAKTPESG